MKLLDVLTKEDIIREYKQTPHFIKCHGRAMGGIGKPMTFDRKRVEAYLDNLFSQMERARGEKEYRAREVQAAIDSAIAHARSATMAVPVGDGQILGKGGRSRAA